MTGGYTMKWALKEELERSAKRTPEEARAYLVKLGTHTPDGDLTPEYGGPPRDGEPDRRPPIDMVSQARDRIARDASRESLAKAASWLERAAAKNCVEALIELADWRLAGRHYPRCLGAAGRLLSQASRLGSDKARFRHYWLIERGEKDMPNARATYIATLADAITGDRAARNLVSRFLDMGFGVRKDPEAAALWKTAAS